MKSLAPLALTLISLVPALVCAGEMPAAVHDSILAHCERQLEAIGSPAMVKFCAEENRAAWQALQRYDSAQGPVIERCRQQMLAIGGWSLTRFCVDEEIAAEKEQQGD